jgi:Protein of unknown function (DUF1573)
MGRVDADHQVYTQVGRKHSPSQAALVLISANLVILIAAVWAWAAFGSIGMAVGYCLRGERLFADATEKGFGVAEPNTVVQVTFKLTNRGDEPIRILGCHANCSCVVPSDLPFTLDRNETRDFTVSIHTPRSELLGSPAGNRLHLPLTLYTNSPVQSRFSLAVKGEVGNAKGMQ